MAFFDYLQIASVVIFLLVITSRAVFMIASRGINPIVIGGGKKGLVRVVELLSFAGLVLWIIELLLYGVDSWDAYTGLDTQQKSAKREPREGPGSGGCGRTERASRESKTKGGC